MNQFQISERNILGRFLQENAKKFGDKTFLIYDDYKISYKQLNENVFRVANGFLNLGVKKGDKVAIMMDNCPEFIYTWFALSEIGAVEVPINIHHKEKLLSYLINYSDAEILVINNLLIPQIKNIEELLKDIKKIIVHPLNSDTEFKNISVQSYENLIQTGSSPPQIEVKYHDLMAILFTSGTTGVSKGVMVSHNQMIFQAYMYCYISKFTENDRMYQYLPLFHAAAQCGGTLAPFLAGATIILRKSFSASAFWDEIRKYRATITGGFEPVLRILYKLPPDEDDNNHHLRTFLCGHVPPDIQEDFQNRFNVKLIDAYGLTETDVNISSTYDDIRIGSCGKAHTEYFDIKLFNEQDIEVPIGMRGEIVIRPLLPHIIMEGYYKMPEKTLETFRNLWFHTGDIAYKDEDGYYYFVDREKDMVRRSGENISSKELEEIINSHQNVMECAVIGIKDEIVGEEIKVALVLKSGKSMSPEEIIEYCDERMAYFMVPRYIEFLNSLPKELDGQKIIKERLKYLSPKVWDRKKTGIKLQREKDKEH